MAENENIMAHLSGDDPNLRAAYQEVAKWYRFFGGRPPKPSREDLRKVAETYQAIYSASPPVGPPIPTMVTPAPVDDRVPTEDEIADAVYRLKNNKATGPTGMKAEHFKEWYEAARPEPKPGEPDAPVPRPEKWNRLVELIQHMFRTGEVPTKCAWSFLAVIPKPDGGQRGVGLVEAVWKVCEAIIDTRVKKVIRFHDILHGFCQTRGTSTAIMEVKLQQEVAAMLRTILFQVYLDLTKAYDTLDRDRTLKTMKEYGVGSRLSALDRELLEVAEDRPSPAWISRPDHRA